MSFLTKYGLFGYNWQYLLLHPWVFVKEIYYSIKYFVQRGSRGYSDRDNWDLFSYLNTWMPEAVQKLKTGNRFPIDVYLELFPNDSMQEMDEQHSAIAHARWHEILDLISAAFIASKRISDFDFTGPEELTLLYQQVNTGLDLFKRYYQSLWD